MKGSEKNAVEEQWDLGLYFWCKITQGSIPGTRYGLQRMFLDCNVNR